VTPHLRRMDGTCACNDDEARQLKAGRRSILTQQISGAATRQDGRSPSS
jgi:hypothetical protein